MSRSLKKGPFCDDHLMKKVEALNAAGKKQVIKTDPQMKKATKRLTSTYFMERYRFVFPVVATGCRPAEVRVFVQLPQGPAFVNLVVSRDAPGFLDHVANKKADVVRLYLPPDANCLLSCFDHCIRSRNYVNVIVASKHPRAGLGCFLRK